MTSPVEEKAQEIATSALTWKGDPPVPEDALVLSRAFLAQQQRIEELEDALTRAARMGQRISREAMDVWRDGGEER